MNVFVVVCHAAGHYPLLGVYTTEAAARAAIERANSVDDHEFTIEPCKVGE